MVKNSLYNMRRYTLFGLLALIMLLCGCTDGRSHSSDFDHPHSSDIDNNNGDRCPSCSSLNIGIWEFGMAPPVANEEIKSGHVHLGGCVVYEDAPQYHCNDCGYDWGKWRMRNNLN